MKGIVIALLFVLPIGARAQSTYVKVIRDLQQDWMVFDGTNYVAHSHSQDSRTIHFVIDPSVYRGTFLRIESEREFSTFVDGKLISSNKTGVVLYDLDSLAKLYTAPLEFSIRKPRVKISTQLVSKSPNTLDSENLVKRKEPYFLNFSIIASMILLVFFVILLRTNPKLTFDYLNFVKLFSAQEREENIMTIRITSSANLLFYTFASLLTAFLLMVTFHFAQSEMSLAMSFLVGSLADCFWQWLQLAALVLFILVGKLILISLFSYLYKAPEITALQFFNFVRLFFFTFGVISIFATAFFIGHVLNPTWYYNLFYIAAGIFVFWEVVIFLKLMTRLPFRIFHLFFYLCASELIPLVILIKVVFY